MADDPTGEKPDGTTVPEDDVTVDSVTAIDASAKPAEPADPAPEGAKPESAAEPDDKPAAKPQRLPEWAEKKLAEAAFEAREAKRRAKELEDRLAKESPAVAAPAAADEAAARDNAPVGGYATPADFQKAVQAEADRRAAAERQAAAQREFDEKCNAAYSKGKANFSADFDVAVQNLQTVGAMHPDVLSLVLETEDPAKVLYELGSDPDRAASLMAMSAPKRAMEIARLSQPAPRKPTQLSKAPAPIPSIDGSARVTAAPSDDDDDETFFRKRAAELNAAGKW